MTLYEILGVAKDASNEDIKCAYRSRAQKTHPDKGGDIEEFQDVKRAYDILSDADRRARYDSTGAQTPEPTMREAAELEVQNLLLQAVMKIDTRFTDLTEEMNNVLSARISQNVKQTIAVAIGTKKIKDVISRITTQSERNLFEQALQVALTSGVAQQNHLEKESLLFKEMQLVLKDYKYRVDVRTNISTGTMGSDTWMNFGNR